MLKVNVVGDIFQPTGYGIHTLELAKALDDIGIDIGLELNYAPPNWENLVTNQVRNMVLKDNRNEINIMITYPYQWMLKKSERVKTIGFGVFEGSKVHSSWSRIANEDFINQIWVPSQHTKDAFITGDVMKTINIVPHGVDLTLFNQDAKPDPNLKSDKFTFLYVGGWAQGSNDRRAVDVLLRAFTSEFKRDDKVRLLLKLNPSYGQDQRFFTQAIESLNLSKKEDRAEIVIIMNLVPYQQLPSVYKTADVFVMPTKAEAFSLTCLESMACGVPVIATNYGGQTEYINTRNGWLVNGEMKRATDMNIFYEEALWMTPYQDLLQKCMRLCFMQQDMVKKKGREAVKDAVRFIWETSAHVARNYLQQL
jgi:hypothetical protein